MGKKVIDIENRQEDYQLIDKQSWRTEHGIRTICVMYDEHSSDKNSKENIFIFKDNVHYRVFSLKHQYLVFLRELSYAENHLQALHQKDPKLLFAFPLGNPHFEKVELEISSLFDSLIIQISSVFDYLSHLTCYICKNDKSKTLYWTKLASSAYGKNNEISELNISSIIQEIDNRFMKKLYNYRSRLLHTKKDEHIFNTSIGLNNLDFNLKILASDISLKHFKAIKKEYPESDITLTFLASWLIKQTFIEIEYLLDALREEIQKNSHYHKNLQKPKDANGLIFMMVDRKSNTGRPISDSLWEQYKNKSH